MMFGGECFYHTTDVIYTDCPFNGGDYVTYECRATGGDFSPSECEWLIPGTFDPDD